MALNHYPGHTLGSRVTHNQPASIFNLGLSIRNCLFYGSDFFHWGEGTISLSATEIVHEGKLAPGPDYKLYLVREFVEHEDEFLSIKDQAQLIGDVKTFDGFLLGVPAGVDIENYTTALIWCEAFGEFITSTKYR